jgi:hypothetical protein
MLPLGAAGDERVIGVQPEDGGRGEGGVGLDAVDVRACSTLEGANRPSWLPAPWTVSSFLMY